MIVGELGEAKMAEPESPSVTDGVPDKMIDWVALAKQSVSGKGVTPRNEIALVAVPGCCFLLLSLERAALLLLATCR